MRLLLVGILFTILSITLARRAHNDDKIESCIREKCPDQLKSCFDDDKCFVLLAKCKTKVEQQPTIKKGSKSKPFQNVIKCLEKNDNAYALIDCAYSNCDNDTTSTVQHLLNTMTP